MNRPSLVDLATASHPRAIATLLFLALVAFLPGFFQIPPVDRDEARFAQATKQMVLTGDYVDIRFQDEVRYKKPVGIYWLQAGVVNAARSLGVRGALRTIALYRIPSLVGAIGAVLLIYWVGLAFGSRRAALMAAMIMAGSILLGVEARLATTDAMLLLAVTAAMGTLARAYLAAVPGSSDGDAGWLLPVIFWTALAAGVLLKGPVILMIVGLTTTTLICCDRSARWIPRLRPVLGMLWFAVLVAPWFLAITSRAGDAFVLESIHKDVLDKMFSAQETHGAPPGTYLLLFCATFWPGAPLAALSAPSVWASRREAGTRFLIAWLAPSWIVFEAAVTKLPHYVLPLYPAIAILTAGAMDTSRLSAKPWLVRCTAWWFVFPSLVAIVLSYLELRVLALPFAALAIVFGYAAWRLYRSDDVECALVCAVLASVLTGTTTYGLTIPALDSFFPSVKLARVVRSSGCERPWAAAVGYQEPSLVFLVGTRTRLTDAPGAAEFLREGPCRFALVESRQEDAFVRRAQAIGLRYALAQRIRGINVNGGAKRQIAIAIYRSP